MRKINCIISDDEALARDVIINHVSKLEQLKVVAICTNGLEAYNAIKNSKADLLFLDIQMPQLTGIELLRTVKNAPAVIITTAYPDFALEGYELNVIDYLLKPISFERLLKAVEKYENWVNPGYMPNSIIHQADKLVITEPFIYVKADKKMVKIIQKDILYLESLKDYVKIHTQNTHVITYQTITYFTEKLPANSFMRIHRSYIVAIDHITAFSSTELTIANIVIPYGSTYSREVLKKLNSTV